MVAGIGSTEYPDRQNLVGAEHAKRPLSILDIPPGIEDFGSVNAALEAFSQLNIDLSLFHRDHTGFGNLANGEVFKRLTDTINSVNNFILDGRYAVTSL